MQSVASKRLELLKGQVNPSEEAFVERERGSFSVEEARRHLWKDLSPLYFQTFEALSKLPDKLLTYTAAKPSAKDEKRLETNQTFLNLLNKVYELGFTTPEDAADNIDAFLDGVTAISMLDHATVVKMSVHLGLYAKTIKNCGTEMHRELLLDALTGKDMGCFGLTEIGHGSNVRGIETTSHYDPRRQSFLLHTPSLTARKFWIGNMGKTAHKAVIWA